MRSRELSQGCGANNQLVILDGEASRCKISPARKVKPLGRTSDVLLIPAVANLGMLVRKEVVSYSRCARSVLRFQTATQTFEARRFFPPLQFLRYLEVIMALVVKSAHPECMLWVLGS
jgi:hypothetical protein